MPHVDFQNGTPPTTPVDTDMQAEPPVQNLFDWDFQTVYLRSEEISTHTDISHLLSEDDPSKTFLMTSFCVLTGQAARSQHFRLFTNPTFSSLEMLKANFLMETL